MNARDIMTSPVISVGPEASVQVIAALLNDRHISAVPVVRNGRLVGMVSEGDLLHRCEIGTDRAGKRGSWWLRLLSAERSPADYIKSHAKRAKDIMAHEVISVSPETPIAEIASILERERIKRVPVMDTGTLVGIVSRSDLVRALATAGRAAKRQEQVSDEAIRRRLTAELERETWWHPVFSNITVTDGVVEFAGGFEAEDERYAACIAAESIPGVRGVEDRRLHMRYLSSAV